MTDTVAEILTLIDEVADAIFDAIDADKSIVCIYVNREVYKCLIYFSHRNSCISVDFLKSSTLRLFGQEIRRNDDLADWKFDMKWRNT